MSRLTLDSIIEIFKEFARGRDISLEVILVGGLSLHYYGLEDRYTIDVDAEVKGDIEELFRFLKARNIPSDMGENISNWSVVAMPPGYRERAIDIYNDKHLLVKVLHPLDFIIAKLRRFTDEDIEDALFVAKKFNISANEIKDNAEKAIENSPKDTALWIFRKNVEIFLERLK